MTLLLARNSSLIVVHFIGLRESFCDDFDNFANRYGSGSRLNSQHFKDQFLDGFWTFFYLSDDPSENLFLQATGRFSPSYLSVVILTGSCFALNIEDGLLPVFDSLSHHKFKEYQS